MNAAGLGLLIQSVEQQLADIDHALRGIDDAASRRLNHQRARLAHWLGELRAQAAA